MGRFKISVALLKLGKKNVLYVIHPEKQQNFQKRNKVRKNRSGEELTRFNSIIHILSHAVFITPSPLVLLPM